MGNTGVQGEYYRIVSKYNYRVNKIGNALLSSMPPDLTSGYQWRFDVIDKTYVNAFAFPGGSIFVTDELIEDLKVTDDELAAVIAHEIGHIVHRHSVKNVVQQMAVMLAWQAIFYEDDDDHKESFGEAIGELLIKKATLFAGLSFSRSHEFQADDEGWKAMVKTAGYNPIGMITFFEKLRQLTPEDDGTTHWDSTHPGTADRILTLKSVCGTPCLDMGSRNLRSEM
jgi:predicted Zn-dependent protease